jgi:signal transduction histidine kinase
MRKLLYLRLFLMSIIGALILSFVSLVFMVRVSDMVVEDYRYGYLLYIARSIERSTNYRPVSDVNVNKFPSPPPLENEALSILEQGYTMNENELDSSVTQKLARKFKLKNDEQSTKPSLWLVNEKGEILSTNNLQGLPIEWKKLPRPKKVHGMTSNDGVLFNPKTFVIRLDTEPRTYLISHNQKTLFQGPFLWIQGMHTFTTATLAMFIALTILFFYLRRKSRQARIVLNRLEQGDLKARFDVKRFDEFGNLLGDFNRMAGQIERLVHRVSETESSRSELIQELGHDLRTPLTSLSTAIETLSIHDKNLEESDRQELFHMMTSDIHYFKELLEKLTIVATIEDPHYKSSTEVIHLDALLDAEVRNRTLSSEKIRWSLDLNANTGIMTILGDEHLITRLFKNAFDNASRFAREAINIQLKELKDSIEVLIMDDGPGLTPETIKAFGYRRERRSIKEKSHEFSLGLGSVIMKTIAEAHDGTISMENLSGRQGACLRINFRKI